MVIGYIAESEEVLLLQNCSFTEASQHKRCTVSPVATGAALVAVFRLGWCLWATWIHESPRLKAGNRCSLSCLPSSGCSCSRICSCTRISTEKDLSKSGTKLRTNRSSPPLLFPLLEPHLTHMPLDLVHDPLPKQDTLFQTEPH